MVPAPITAALRGRQIRSRRWISYAWAMPFSTTVSGSSSTATSRSPSGIFTMYSGSST